MELRPYQRSAVERIKAEKILGIFSEQRTGKTPIACVSLLELGIDTVLIICPKSMVHTWKHEYEMWTGKTAQVLKKTTLVGTVWEHGALIVNYEKLRGTAKKGQPLVAELIKSKKVKAIVLDEAHRINNRQKLTAVAMNKLRNKVPIRLALTSTPAGNKPWDVWNIMHWLRPDVWTSYWNFVEEYFFKERLFISGKELSNPVSFRPGYDVLLAKELDKYAVQHKRGDIMPWVREADVMEVQLDCTPTQRKAIDDLMKYFEHKHIITQNILENLIRIRQVCAAPKILDLRGSSPKIDWLIDYIEDYPNKSILCFSHSRKFIELIYDTLLKKGCTNVSVITGAIKPHQRYTTITQFQSGICKILLNQTQATKEGLTLDQADVTIFLDTYPPLVDYEQAKDRMVAVTEERVKPKEIIHLMMKDTYDTELFNLVQHNVNEAEVVNNYKKYIGRS